MLNEMQKYNQNLKYWKFIYNITMGQKYSGSSEKWLSIQLNQVNLL